MTSHSGSTRLSALSGVSGLALSLALTACSEPAGPNATGLNALNSPAFSLQVPLDSFQQQLTTTPARVRIVLQPTGLVATQVQIRRSSQAARPEHLESAITAISVAGPDSNVTLELGGLTVGFNASTRFDADDDRAEDDDVGLTAAGFVTRVQAALTAGRHPAVEVSRAAPATPQDPGTATFVADVIRLDEGREHPVIEMNVTSANLLSNATPPPDAWLEVLGLKIELRVSDGTTKLEGETARTEGEQRFRGVVKSVDQGAGTATLADGTVLHVVTGTRFDSGDEDGGTFQSLADVKAALDGGKTVLAKGEGLLTGSSPRTFDVIRVRFAVPEPAEEGEGEGRFAGQVSTADSTAGTATLADGTVLRFVTGTEIEGDNGGMPSLPAVQLALAGGKTVMAEGKGLLVSTSPTTLDVIEVRFTTQP